MYHINKVCENILRLKVNLSHDNLRQNHISRNSCMIGSIQALHQCVGGMGEGVFSLSIAKMLTPGNGVGRFC